MIYGHSHRPAIDERDGVVFFNPGAAGHRRFNLPITVGRLRIEATGRVDAVVVDLEGEGQA